MRSENFWDVRPPGPSAGIPSVLGPSVGPAKVGKLGASSTWCAVVSSNLTSRVPPPALYSTTIGGGPLPAITRSGFAKRSCPPNEADRGYPPKQCTHTLYLPGKAASVPGPLSLVGTCKDQGP